MARWTAISFQGDIQGTISDNNATLAFFGTGLNDNICYIGLNIPFYYYLTQDTNAEKLMQWVMGMEPGILPEREIFPISVDYGSDEIIIDSNVDYINTGLAYHDCFRSDQSIFVDNGLLITRSGRTRIEIVYPYLIEGILVTALGAFLLIVLLLYVRRSDMKDRGLIKVKEKKEEPQESKEKEYFYPELEKLDEEKKDKEEKPAEKIIEQETEKEIIEEEPEEETENISEEEPLVLAETKPENSAIKDFDIPMKTGDDFDIPLGNR